MTLRFNPNTVRINKLVKEIIHGADSGGNDSVYYDIFNENLTASETEGDGDGNGIDNVDDKGQGGEQGINSIPSTVTSAAATSSQLNKTYVYGYWMMMMCPFYYYALLLRK